MKPSLTVLIVLLLVPLIALQGAESKRPNVILILVDDMGWGDLGCYPKDSAAGPDAIVATPHIDRLAATGVRFTQGYAAHMVCAPSRAGMLAGRYQHRFGFYGFNETNAGIPRDIQLLPQAMREAGYATGLIGKWHVGYSSGFKPLDRGFDRFFGFLGGEHDYFEDNLGQPMHTVVNAPDAWTFDQEQPVATVKYLTDEFTDRTIAFIDEAAKTAKPFFLYLSYNAPHAPLQVPWEDLEFFAQQRPKGEFTDRDIARAMISRLDNNVGRLMKSLGERGLENDTLVIFTSDNGGAEHCHNAGLRGRKGYFYEGGIRVPLIMYWPGHLPAGMVFDEPVIQLDFFPTLLAAAGVDKKKFPPGLDGVNLLPFLNGSRKGPVHEQLFWNLAASNGRWAVRSGPWKLVNEDTNPPDEKKTTRAQFKIQLYNIEADPFEHNDLADAHPDRVAQLQQLVTSFTSTFAPSLYTTKIEAAHRAALDARKNRPELQSREKQNGSPGHWR